MKETLSKMAELKFEAPLAQFEEADEWQSADFRLKNLNEKSEMQVHENMNTIDAVSAANANVTAVTNGQHEDDYCPFEDNEYASVFSDSRMATEQIIDPTVSDTVNNNVLGDNFAETVSGSLEDLVNTFDEKITRCFHNYQESVEKLAPVQVRSQEEIMNECQ